MDKIEEIIAKVYDMGGISKEHIVRVETIKWAKEQIRQLEPKPDESRLLTEEQLIELLVEESNNIVGDLYYTICSLVLKVRNLQDAKTASIKVLSMKRG
jgi:hypothetical protein